MVDNPTMVNNPRVRLITILIDGSICTKQLSIVIVSTFSIVETFARRATRRTLEQTSINS